MNNKPYLMNTRDPDVENSDLLIASPHDSDELVIRRTNKDGSKSEYLISLKQLVVFITNSVVTENGDNLETTECHSRNVRASGGF